MSILFCVPLSMAPLCRGAGARPGLGGQKFILGTQKIYTLSTNSDEKRPLFTIHLRPVHNPFKNFLIFLKKGLAKCLKLW